MIFGEAPPTAGLPVRWSDFGPSTPSGFSSAIGEFLGATDVLVTCSGTASLLLIFAFLKMQSKRRTVLIPAYTCPLVAFAALHHGLKVVSCDTAPNSVELDLRHLEGLIDDDTLCVVATHYGGAIVDIAKIRDVLDRHSNPAYVVEDAAQAFGATCRGGSVGHGGDFGLFSFSAGKGLTIFEGGCVIARDPSLMASLQKLEERFVRSDWLAEAARSAQLIGHYISYNRLGLALTYGARRRYWLRRRDPAKATDDVYGSNIPLHKVGGWRMSVGSRALRRLPAHLERARECYRYLGDELRRLPGLELHEPVDGAQPSCTYRFLTFDSEDRCKRTLDAIWPSPLGVSKPYLHAILDYPFLAGRIVDSVTPNARSLAARTIAITTSSLLTEEGRGALLGKIRELAT